MGKTPKAIRLFNNFLTAYEKIGTFQLHPVKTRVALLGQTRFASVNKLGKDHLTGHLVLTETHSSPIIYKIDNLKDRFYVHHFRISDSSDLTKDFKRLMQSAYQIGQRSHIKKKAVSN